MALVLLAATANVVGRFVADVHQGLQDRELSSRIGWELENARERIRSWAAADVTQERIEKLPISPMLAQRLVQPRWQAEVQPEELSLAATRVTLQLHCQFRGQTATPAQLTFWVEGDRDGE